MTTLGRIRLAIVHDHPIFCDGLRRLLSDEPDFEVVGAGAVSDAIAMVRTRKPDVVLVDLVMSGPPALELLQSLDASGSTRVIVLTASTEQEQTLEALRRGARGAVSKETTTALLIKCVRVVLDGQYWIGRGTVGSLVGALRIDRSSKPKPGSRFGLTPRQMEIVRGVATGASNRDIAGDLGISEDTVKQHMASIFDKCGVSSRVELAVFALNHGIVESKPSPSPD